jgi:hypothetical protein
MALLSIDQLVESMFTKRIILLIIGIGVAIAICFSTSLFGMKLTRTKTYTSGPQLKSYSHIIFITNGYLNRKSMVAEF